MTGSRHFSLREAAVFLRLSPRQVMRHVASGALLVAEGGGRGRPLQFRYSDLHEFAAMRQGTGTWTDLGEEIEVLARARGAVEEMARIDWGYIKGETAWIPPSPMSGFVAWFRAKGSAARHRAMDGYVRKWPKNAARLAAATEWAEDCANVLGLGEMRWLAATIVAMGIRTSGFRGKAVRLLEAELAARAAEEPSEVARRRQKEYKRLLLADDPGDFESSWRWISENWRGPGRPPMAALKAAVRTERASRKHLFRTHQHQTVAWVLGVSRMQEWRLRQSALKRLRGALMRDYLRFRARFL